MDVLCMVQNKHSCRFLDNIIYVLANYSFFFSKSCDQLWLQPEMEELRTAFNKLKKLTVCGIFVEFDILWTTAFLVAAPSIEKLLIKVMPLSVFLSFLPHLEFHFFTNFSEKMLKTGLQ